MINKIKIGEYVRNESGYINKINSFDRLTNFFKDDDGKLKEWIGEDIWGNTIAESIVKHSKNIINLVEVGDYVNGEVVIKIYDKNQKYKFSDYVFEEKTIETYNDNYETIPFENLYINSDIKSIVTKEQFESVKYKV